MREFQSEPFARALGMSWLPSSDAFIMQQRFSAISNHLITNQQVLSRIAQMFDPLGWLKPATIVAKILPKYAILLLLPALNSGSIHPPYPTLAENGRPQ